MIKLARRGFTLVELLVVIAIIGVLIALLLPAVQQAREAARRMQCTNNQKQLGLALHTFHDSHRAFPTGLTGFYQCSNTGLSSGKWFGPNSNSGSIGWGTHILPFLEQTALHDQITSTYTYKYGFDKWCTSGILGRVPQSAYQTVLEAYICPSDQSLEISNEIPSAGKPIDQRFAKANYVACAGAAEFGLGSRTDISGNGSGTIYDYHNGDMGGVMFQGHPKYAGVEIDLASIIDGTSNTLMVSERSGEIMSSGRTRNAAAWIGGNENRTREVAFTTAVTPNSVGSDTIEDTCAASMHPGGVNACLADGSVRFIAETTDKTAYLLLGSRADGQVIGEF